MKYELLVRMVYSVFVCISWSERGWGCSFLLANNKHRGVIILLPEVHFLKNDLMSFFSLGSLFLRGLVYLAWGRHNIISWKGWYKIMTGESPFFK